MVYNELSKTLGPRTAALFRCMAESGQTVFNTNEAAKCMKCDSRLAAAILYKAKRRGLITPIARGLYNLVPFEADNFYSQPLLIAKEAVRSEKFFFSHGSAMELHRMTTQPNFEVFITVVKRQASRTLAGTPVHFVTVKADRFFGYEPYWLTKTEKVMVSDKERTIIDGLTTPEYCGGLLDVAKGLWLASQDINVERLIEYSLQLDIRAVSARLGYLLELYRLATPNILKLLRRHLTRTVHLLDPQSPKEGKINSEWRLQVNLSPDELLEQRAT